MVGDELDYSITTNTCETRFGLDSVSALEAVLAGVACATNRTASALPLLYRIVDPETLASLFIPSRTETPSSEVTVRFEYAETRVVVTGNAGHGGAKATILEYRVDGGRTHVHR